ncbi:MAG: hypothetical protein AB7F86_07265 [Bdellovibrionales bacterium]
MIGPVRFVFSVMWFAIGLATLGTLKDCTLTMAGMAAKSQQSDVISLGQWNRKLVGNGK